MVFMLLLVLWEFRTMYFAHIPPSPSPPRPFHSPLTQLGVFSFTFYNTSQFVLFKYSWLCGISLDLFGLPGAILLVNWLHLSQRLSNANHYLSRGRILYLTPFSMSGFVRFVHVVFVVILTVK